MWAKGIWILYGSYLMAPATRWALLIGLCLGSFLNVCIYRIPEGTFWKNARSICRKCSKPIAFYDNIPVLSFLFLRGRGRCCGAKISWQYPAVELLTGLLVVALYWQTPFLDWQGDRWVFDTANFLRCLHSVTFTCLLLVCAVIDIHHMIIPDVISLPMIALTPLVVALHPDLTWRSAALGVLVGGGSLYAIAWIYWLVRREVGLGMGDVKLLAAIGGWMGYQAVIPTIFVGSISGSIIGLLAMIISRKLSLRTAIPFGPFLVLGALVYLLFGQAVQDLFAVGS